MIVILKPLFEILTGDVAVMDNVIYNYLIMLVVGEIAYRIAWNFVGDLYRMGAIDGKASGSIIHWTIRLIAYVVCAYIIRGCIWLQTLIVAIPHRVWWIIFAGVLVLLTVFISIVIHRRIAFKKSSDTESVSKIEKES